MLTIEIHCFKPLWYLASAVVDINCENQLSQLNQLFF